MSGLWGSSGPLAVAAALLGLLGNDRQHPLHARSAAPTAHWRVAVASYYGPGLYGRHTASGRALRYGDGTIANRSMRFGTRCTFRYRGRTAVGTVSDRGPFVAGRTFDLEQSLARRLRMEGSGVATVKYRCTAPRRHHG